MLTYFDICLSYSLFGCS